jgi:large subunit ribosomal protein L31
MKAAIHPKWYPEANIVCACGNTFVSGSSQPEIKVDVCYSCHPFYTGTMKFLDAAGRVDAFKARQKGASAKVVSKTEKRKLKREKKLQEELARPTTLSALRSKE